jgi:hypothetical protein
MSASFIAAAADARSRDAYSTQTVSSELLMLPMELLNLIMGFLSLHPAHDTRNAQRTVLAVYLHPLAVSCRVLRELVAAYTARRLCIASTSVQLWSVRNALLQHVLAGYVRRFEEEEVHIYPNQNERYTSIREEGGCFYYFDPTLERRLSAMSEAWLLDPQRLQSEEHPFRRLALATSGRIRRYVTQWYPGTARDHFNLLLQSGVHPRGERQGEMIALATACETLELVARINSECQSDEDYELERIDRENEEYKRHELEQDEQAEHEEEEEERRRWEEEQDKAMASEIQEADEEERRRWEEEQDKAMASEIQEADEEERPRWEEERYESDEWEETEEERRWQAEEEAEEEDRRWLAEEDRRRERERTREDAVSRALRSHYVALLLPQLELELACLERLHAQFGALDPMLTPVASAKERVRILQLRGMFESGRSAETKARVEDLSDSEFARFTGPSRISQAAIDVREEAMAENVLECWEMNEGGGFKFVAYHAPRDDDWSCFLMQYEETGAVPTAAASNGSDWGEQRRVGPPIEDGQVLVGPLPQHWQTGGRDPAEDQTLTCRLQ